MTKKSNALTRKQLLEGLKAPESQSVDVPGLGSVEMVPLPYEDLMHTVANAGADRIDQEIMIVVKVVKELEETDAYKLRKSNGPLFALLNKAVNDYLGYRITKDKIKN